MEQTSGRDNLGKLAPSLFPQLKAHYSTKNGGQILICVEGEGWFQEEGKDPQSLKVRDVITIPANVKY